MDSRIYPARSRHCWCFYVVCSLLIIDILLPVASSRPRGGDFDKSRPRRAVVAPGEVQSVGKLSASQSAPQVGRNAKHSRQFQEYSGQVTYKESVFDQQYNDYIPNEIPVHPGRQEKDQARQYALEKERTAAPGFGPPTHPAAPKYMIELYNKFSSDRYASPVTNIVRSFMNVNKETTTPPKTSLFGNKTRVHTLVFNITSIAADEDIYLAELRLYKLVEADRNQFLGVNRRVSVHEIVRNHTTHENTSELITTKDLYDRHSGWETFPVTEAVTRWVQAGLTWTSQILEVRIDSFLGDAAAAADMDIDTRPQNDNEPLLVVFSNEMKKVNQETRELHEMGLLSHDFAMYDIILDEEANEIGEDYDDEYYYDDVAYTNGLDYEQLKEEWNLENGTSRRWKRSLRAGGNVPSGANALPKRALESVPKHLVESLYRSDDHVAKPTKAKITKRSNRSRRKRKRGRRRYCRRRPLYVNFQDINWHTWIVAPTGYQAYQCAGRCVFPLSDHLTPTKHAIVQTLVHSNHGGLPYYERAEAACCVPTKLGPMSILYIDEMGIPTFKYDYDDMVVRECGCR